MRNRMLGGRPLPLAVGMGDYLPETSTAAAIGQPAAEIGIGALAGFGALVILVFLYSSAKSKVQSATAPRGRRKKRR